MKHIAVVNKHLNMMYMSIYYTQCATLNLLFCTIHIENVVARRG
jgi:hypothetical protein